MNLEKTYTGIIVRSSNQKRFGFIKSPSIAIQGYEPDLFFHYSRYDRSTIDETNWKKFIGNGKIVQFRLLHSKKYPGKLAGTHLFPVKKYWNYKKVLKHGIINSDEKYENLKIDLKNMERDLSQSEYKNIAQLAYDNSSPENRLMLWADDLSHIFNFEQFKKFVFVLDRYGLKKFKRYAKQHFEIKRNELRTIQPSIFIEVDEDGNIIYETSWKDIGFLDKKIMILNDKGDKLYFQWGPSKSHFNMVIRYIQRKQLESLKVYVKLENIIKIEGLDKLQEAILVIQKRRLKKKFNDLIKEGYSPQEDAEFRNLTDKELLEIFGKHEFIDYLQNFQSTSFDMKLIYYNSSYLFSIPIPTEKQVVIIWESIKLDRATYIFRCDEDEYFNIFSDIESYLKSDIFSKRAQLIGRGYDSAKFQEDFRYVGSLKHVGYDFNKWQKNLHKIVPEMKLLEEEINYVDTELIKK